MLRCTLIALALLLAQPAAAQLRLGETGLTLNATGVLASDYLFRGISQTRSRPAVQLGTAEVSHSSGFYVGAFVSNFRFVGTDGRQEVDLLGGYRFTVADFNVDLGVVWYLYPGYTRQPGQFGLNYAEGVLKVNREIGAVTLYGTLAGAPNFFGSSGTGIYVEGGVDWRTGVQGIVLGGRVAHQWIERNPRFGTPDYTWWAAIVSRDFPIANFSTLNASIGYYQTSIRHADCVPTNGRGQDVCGARALAALAFRF